MTGQNTNTSANIPIRNSKEDSTMIKSERRLKDSQDDGPISTLPNEILSHVLSFLDAPRDLSEGLLDEPCFDLTVSTIANLKAASCVSKQWRQAAFPMLFKHLHFIVPEPKDTPLALNDQIRPFLEFAESNSLRSIIESFVLIVKDAKVHAKGQLPSLKSADGFSSFWLTIFDLLDPPDLLIIAPLEALAKLAACHNIEQEDAWNFDCPCRKSLHLTNSHFVEVLCDYPQICVTTLFTSFMLLNILLICYFTCRLSTAHTTEAEQNLLFCEWLRNFRWSQPSSEAPRE